MRSVYACYIKINGNKLCSVNFLRIHYGLVRFLRIEVNHLMLHHHYQKKVIIY